MGYETDSWREPTPDEDEIVLRSEHGRIVFNIDYRSHWFVLVRGKFHEYTILVKHGGGEERLHLPIVNSAVVARIIASLSSDDAYLLMHTLFDINRHATHEATLKAETKYRKAFTEGRLKKRRLPAQGVTKVWIEEAAR